MNLLIIKRKKMTNDYKDFLQEFFKDKHILIRGYYVGVLVISNPKILNISDNGNITLMSDETIQMYYWNGLKKGNINEIPNLKKLSGEFIINNHPTIINEGYQYTVISDELYEDIKKNVINK